ncbi:SGNH/GDSL hydrolase family protein [Sphingomonas endolithica]|uniref:SGNH/GDSL hydrolase family protein n=1 Tax=Sphingomonas endolithica TaxID=2972485 RepID=UPI0021AEF498|nr:SGNH/GDSL hydrolase family protein [Sphingomonas sp. ZFBP2030]
MVRIAKVDERGTIVPGTERVVYFSGQGGATMPANGTVLGDAIDMKTAPFDRVAVSIYFPDEIAAPTYHDYANATHWIAPGDQTAAAKLRDPSLFISMAVLAGIDVENGKPVRTIVAFGDSITDGAHATLNLDRRWPDLLARRLQQNKRNIGVANAGIGGNQLLRDGGALSGVNRFERDALNVPGVSHVIVLEGVNDLGIAAYAKLPLPTSEQMIAGYRQMIAAGHARGVKVILATITPYKGARYWSEDGEKVRQAVNGWIRENKEADGFVDFDKSVSDPANPQAIAKQFNGTDKLHPNDQGFLAMANAINLNLFR